MPLLAPVDNGAEGGAAPLSPVGVESRALKARDCPRFTRDGPRLHEIDPRRAARAQRRESTRDCARLPETGHRASNALQPLSRALSRRPSCGTRPRPSSAAGTRR